MSVVPIRGHDPAAEARALLNCVLRDGDLIGTDDAGRTALLLRIDPWTLDRLLALAAYAFAKAGRLEEAVDAIEGGRARLMSEALELGRRDLERLPAMGHGRLYRRFQVLSEQLRQGGLSADEPASLYLQNQAAETREKTSTEFTNTLSEIRSLPGFEHLLAKTSKQQIIQASEHKPLIYLLDTPAGGLALIVSSESRSELSIESVWLPQLNEDAARSLMISGQGGSTGYISGFARYRRNPKRHWRSWMDEILAATGWLWDAVFEHCSQRSIRSSSNPASSSFLVGPCLCCHGMPPGRRRPTTSGAHMHANEL